MIKKNIKSSGFTLIEILIASALSVLLLFVITSTLVRTLSSRQQGVSMSDLQKTNTNIINELTAGTRWAASLSLSQATKSIFFESNSGEKYYIELDNNNLVKILPDGTQINLNSEGVNVDNFDMAWNPDDQNPSGYTFMIELSSRENSELRLETINAISHRISAIVVPKGNLPKGL